ncbi:hypothetical protein Trydic_g5040 [Trypoxylus dichotomus]
MFWNAQGIAKKKNEARAFITDNEINVALLLETFLKASHTFNITNYTTYRTDRNTKPGGGTAILVRKEIKHHSIGRNMTKIKEADIDAVLNFHHPTILAGDSKHPQWNSKTLTRKEKQLKKNSDERNLTVDAPTEDTHIHAPTGLTNVLDLVILKNVTTPYYLETINDLSSDHLPVIMTVSIENSNIQQTIRTTNWQKFEKNLKLRPTSISTDNDIDTVVKQFKEDITLALDSATTAKLKTTREKIPNYIKIKIHQKKLLHKQYKRTLHPNAKTLRNITNEIKKDHAEHYNDQWDAEIENINDDHTELWKVTKILKTKKEKILPILGTHGIIKNNSDKTEEFA